MMGQYCNWDKISHIVYSWVEQFYMGILQNVFLCNYGHSQFEITVLCRGELFGGGKFW